MWFKPAPVEPLVLALCVDGECRELGLKFWEVDLDIIRLLYFVEVGAKELVEGVPGWVAGEPKTSPERSELMLLDSFILPPTPSRFI